ncbi:CAP domain-containing protein [Georgenia phoenicis]|uniref:CAP domain-containing protein n=1 Tax=unclassified Georgenia TaxID=2626815 RepID=UPI0039B11A75
MLLAALLGACGGAEPSPESSAEPSRAAADTDVERYAGELVQLTNETREDEGLAPLVGSDCAREAALERATALVGEDELVHAPLGPVIEACAPLTTAAENLVNSTAVPIDVVDAWLGSPGHRANIVDPDLTEVGVGCVPDGEKFLCSQVFLGP